MSEQRLKFGTDGVRGRAGEGALRPDSVERLGRALGDFLAKDGAVTGPVVLGGDTRASRDEITSALGAGLGRRDVSTVDLGVLPTAALGIVAEDYDAVASVVISASHNPAEDNGIKIFTGHGAKIGDEDAAWIERRWTELAGESPSGPGRSVQQDGEGAERYLRRLRDSVPGLDLSGRRLVLDLAHGAAYRVGPELFEGLGAEVTAIGNCPDGANINKDCGSLHTEGLARTVIEQGADFGVAVDGDADRCILVDAAGELVDGDGVLAITARDLIAKDALPQRTVVGTIMTNFGLEQYLRDRECQLVRTPVGDRHVSARLRQDGLVLGGEPSGHVIFGADLAFLGDGLYTALRVAELLQRRQASLREALEGLALLPQIQVAVRVSQQPEDVHEVSGFREKHAHAEERLAGRGRIVVRNSGTEPVVRVMVEGEDPGVVQEIAEDLAGQLRQEIGA